MGGSKKKSQGCPEILELEQKEVCRSMDHKNKDYAFTITENEFLVEVINGIFSGVREMQCIGK